MRGRGCCAALKQNRIFEAEENAEASSRRRPMAAAICTAKKSEDDCVCVLTFAAL